MMLNSKRSSHLEAGLILSPILSVALIFIWFSVYTIGQSPNIDASFVNPVGFLISNLVFDGFINAENIALSCTFLLVILLFFPSFLRIRSALLLPAIAVASGVLTELAAAITCDSNCSIYGMSGIAGGVIGFTFANFAIVFGLLLKSTRKTRKSEDTAAKYRLPKFTIPVSFIAYVILLLFLSGFFSIHPSITNSFSVSMQVPASIADESHSVQVGHTTGLTFGFLICFALLILSLKRTQHS